jgi:hypothetical protein
MEQGLLASLTGNPAEALVTLVTSSALVFYWAEAGLNDKVNDYWDAFHYIATCLSVGYANIFPVTPVGKIVGALVMMVGPALSSKALDGGGVQAEKPGLQPEMVAKLDEILAELRRIRGER